MYEYESAKVGRDPLQRPLQSADAARSFRIVQLMSHWANALLDLDYHIQISFVSKGRLRCSAVPEASIRVGNGRVLLISNL